MKTSDKIKIAYFAFAFFYALYAWNFGDTAHKSFAYNIGQGLAWPFVMFPKLGYLVGSILIVVFIALVTFLG